jgi:hypothetical protein
MAVDYRANVLAGMTPDHQSLLQQEFRSCMAGQLASQAPSDDATQRAAAICDGKMKVRMIQLRSATVPSAPALVPIGIPGIGR